MHGHDGLGRAGDDKSCNDDSKKHGIKEKEEEPHGAENGVKTEEHNTEEASSKNIFKSNVSLKNFRSDSNIFQLSNEEKKHNKESEFLKLSITKNRTETKDEVCDVVFRANANLHKFMDEWENIGTGTLYITEKEGKRCFFVRDGVMLTAFNFLVKYDTKPMKKKLSVCIAVREAREGKIMEQPYCIVFKDENVVEEFMRLVKI